MKTLLAAALVATAAGAAASPNHAHWHYMIGARASGGRTCMKQLFHEAMMPGEFHLELARSNAAEAQRFAEEIAQWAGAIGDVSSPEEIEATSDHLQAMIREAKGLASGSAELGTWIDASLAARSSGSAVDRVRIAERAQALFHGFGTILALHKDAENALGIPAPADPPPVGTKSPPSP